MKPNFIAALLLASLLLAPFAGAWDQSATAQRLVEHATRSTSTGNATLDIAAGDFVELRLNTTWLRTCSFPGGGTGSYWAYASMVKPVAKSQMKYDYAARTWAWNVTLTAAHPSFDICANRTGVHGVSWGLTRFQSVCSRVRHSAPKGFTVPDPSAWTCVDA